MREAEFLNKIIENNSKYKLEKKFGIVQGYIGEMLVLAYLWNITKEAFFKKTFFEHLEVLINSDSLDYTFGRGITSLLWLVEVISAERLIDISFEKYIDLTEANTRLEKELYCMIDNHNFDYFYGALGLLFYFSQHNDRSYIHRCTNYFIDELEDIIENNKIIYTKKKRNNNYERVVNFGTPHGYNGMLLVLLILKEKTENPRLDALIQYCTEFILQHRYEQNQEAYFPAFVYTDGEKEKPIFAWCYGDLIVSYSILKAGKLLSEPKIYENGKDIALSIIHKCLSINNLCLCHGTPSMYYILKKISDLEVDCYEINIVANKILHKTKDLLEQKIKAIDCLDNSEKVFFIDRSLFYGYSSALLTICLSNNPNAKWQDCLLL
ncbi:MAG: hypothetical protein IKI67_05080 [Bacteroidales bacterium]|nr:hypothetical protein [Bacteroidales bacterium]